MISRKELLRSKEYWLAKFQSTLYEQVEKYLQENQLTRTQFAEQLGVSKGYVSQILNGDFDHKISKFIELSIAIDKAPEIIFEDLDAHISNDGKAPTKTNVREKKKNNSATISSRHQINQMAHEPQLQYETVKKKKANRR